MPGIVDRARRQYRRFSTSLLYFPMLMTAGAIGLFAATSVLDRAYVGSIEQPLGDSTLSFLVFAGSATSASTILGSIAGTWATIAGVVYSVTLVTIQLSATKYSAQVIPTFERDRFNQVVLGAFTGTFAYALLVLKTVRVPTEAEAATFVPFIGVNLAILLALVSLFLFVAFVGNLTAYIRPTRFVDDLAKTAEKHLMRLRNPRQGAFAPLRDGLPPHPEGLEWERAADEHGYVGGFDWETIDDALGGADPDCVPLEVEFLVGPGERFEQGDVLLRARGAKEEVRFADHLRRGIRSEDVPGASGDAFYAAETFSDIAVTAMSGGATDVGVANACVNALSRLAVADIGAGPVPPAFRWTSGGRSVVIRIPTRRPYEACLLAFRRIIDKTVAERYATTAEAIAEALSRILASVARSEDEEASARVLSFAEEAIPDLATFAGASARRRIEAPLRDAAVDLAKRGRTDEAEALLRVLDRRIPDLAGRGGAYALHPARRQPE